MERETRFGRLVADAVKSPHEVQMPCGAAELAVGDDMIAELFLFGYKRADAVVLNLRQFSFDDFPRLISESCLFQCCGAQKAAHIIVVKRCR